VYKRACDVSEFLDSSPISHDPMTRPGVAPTRPCLVRCVCPIQLHTPCISLVRLHGCSDNKNLSHGDLSTALSCMCFLVSPVYRRSCADAVSSSPGLYCTQMMSLFACSGEAEPRRMRKAVQVRNDTNARESQLHASSPMYDIRFEISLESVRIESVHFRGRNQI